MSASPGPVLVVGASLAGATVAATLRESGYAGKVTLLGAEPWLPYERPALSKGYLAGDVTGDDLLVRPASFYDSHGIELRTGERASALDPDRRHVALASGDRLTYGTVVVATGADVLRPPIPGIDLDGVFALRTLSDADGLRAAARAARTAVVIGMGFIGCEVTATLRKLGLEVSAVDAGPGPLWGPLGPELSGVARRWHEEHGVQVLAGGGVSAILPQRAGAHVAAVQLDNGRRLPADLVVLGVGVRPQTAWLADTPLHLVGGAVGVDVVGRTNLPDVVAVGDVTAPWDEAAGAHRRQEHWAAAIAQGRRAALHIAGLPPEPEAEPYFWSDQYDKTLQYAGRHDADSRLVVRGDLADGERFTAFYLEKDTVRAVVAVNDGKQFRRGMRLIGQRVDLRDLRDPTADLRELTPAGTSPR